MRVAICFVLVCGFLLEKYLRCVLLRLLQYACCTIWTVSLVIGIRATCVDTEIAHSSETVGGASRKVNQATEPAQPESCRW